MASSPQPLRVGFVPEHFSTPLHLALTRFALAATLRAFPAGTGHMVAAMRAGELDVAVGLTEGWIAGLGRATSCSSSSAAAAESAALDPDPGYRLVGTYVQSPLCWAIATGAAREDVVRVEALRGARLGVSRVGSGSFVMGYVLAEGLGWLARRAEGEPSSSPFTVVPLEALAQLRAGVVSGAADFFLWEHFTTKQHFDSGELRRVGEIYTPWPSWMVVASTALLAAADGRLEAFFQKVDLGVAYFEGNVEEVVGLVVGMGYSEEDARAWLPTVRFVKEVKGVDAEVVRGTMETLRKAGVLKPDRGMGVDEMIAFIK
ncbi:MAG: hypothetical protein M1829_004726 [Trizodia sp. TS-e1964]|nr:MAG: hypothetical protein M1829_004726 [Trizodia sp. TS-e1964]